MLEWIQENEWLFGGGLIASVLAVIVGAVATRLLSRKPKPAAPEGSASPIQQVVVVGPGLPAAGQAAPPPPPPDEPSLGEPLFEGPGGRPALEVPFFVGRDEELTALSTQLGGQHTAVCVVASGIGGVGKTVLAQQYVATRAPQAFPKGVAWLDGAQLPTELARVARRFGWMNELDPTPEQAGSYLAQHLHDRRVLLVVDNVALDPIDRPQLLFPGGRCRTLLTSRATTLHTELGVPAASLELGQWSPAACRSYLRAVAPTVSQEPDADLDRLCAFVGRLPLAVRLLAWLLRRSRGLTPSGLLDRVRAEPIGTLDSVATERDRGVAATFLWRALGRRPTDPAGIGGVCARHPFRGRRCRGRNARG